MTPGGSGGNGLIVFTTMSASQCLAGTYYDIVTTLCVSCPSGFYQAYNGAYSCPPCPLGYAMSGVGSTQCSFPSSQPSKRPSSQPSEQPTRQPSSQPSAQPSSQPSCQPSRQPTSQPSAQPSSQPSTQPAQRPSAQPSVQPSSQPWQQPTGRPTSQPSRQPSKQPSCQPTGHPSPKPVVAPTSDRVYTYTGGMQNYTVPAGVNFLRISMWGAGGHARTRLQNLAAANHVLLSL